MKVAVIILNYNSHADTAKCIGFLQQQQGVALDIVVVDNCSATADVEALRVVCSAAGCTLITNTKNRGYNAGNNIGLRYATAQGHPYALIANPDMEFPDVHYVATLVREMEAQREMWREAQQGAEQQLQQDARQGTLQDAQRTSKYPVIVASDIVTPEGIHQNPIKRDGDWRASWGWVGDFFRPNKPKDTYTFIDDYTRSHTCAKVSGCCFLIGMDFVERLGYFDEGVFLYCEEPILARQVERAGYSIYYTTATQAVHRHVKSEKGNPLPRLRYWKQARHYYIDHYSDGPWYGKIIAKASVSTYVGLLGWYKRMKR